MNKIIALKEEEDRFSMIGNIRAIIKQKRQMLTEWDSTRAERAMTMQLLILDNLESLH